MTFQLYIYKNQDTKISVRSSEIELKNEAEKENLLSGKSNDDIVQDPRRVSHSDSCT